MKVIVTGASRGIGRGIATVLGRNGFEVGLVARSEELLKQIAQQVDADGGRGTYEVADLRDEGQTTTAIERLIDRLNGLDALVNNAGVIIRKPVMELSSDEWHAMIETNVNGVFYATRAALPRLIEQGRGHVVNVSSIGGYQPVANGSGYAASKYAVTGFGESMMQEVRQHGVKVSTLFPGSVDTESHRGEAGAAETWKLTPEQIGESCLHVLRTAENHLISRVEIRPLRPPRR